MDMSDDDLRRALVGVFALTYREMNGGSAYKSRESFESLMALVGDFGGYRLNFEFKNDEPAPVLVERAAKQIIEEAELRLFKTLTNGALAFVDFCNLVREEVPGIDVEGLIERLALRAARGYGGGEEGQPRQHEARHGSARGPPDGRTG